MAEIIRKTTSTNDPLNIGFMRTYYVDGKEVYKEELDQNLDIKQHAGSLPDGTVKEFFENGKLYCTIFFNFQLKQASVAGSADTPDLGNVTSV